MVSDNFCILQINNTDIGGGAARVALDLHRKYSELRYNSWLAVGYKRSTDPKIICIPNNDYHNLWANKCLYLSDYISILNRGIKGIWRLRRILEWLAQPRRQWELHRGIEDFNYPGSHRILELVPQRVDIVHCHTLHGRYFDLRILSWLSQELPVIMTLHDAWLLSGHCAHSFDCKKWMMSCGDCPALDIYPSIKRDATDYNWRRKRKIYAKTKIYLAAPSKWLMQRIEQSILAPSILESRIIPYGIDLSIFHPADKQATREMLGIPQDTRVVLFAANGIKKNIWKDYQTMYAVINLLAKQLYNQNLIFIGLGEDAPVESVGNTKIYFIPYQKNPDVVAQYYQAADVYMHAAKIDTFPNTILEAMACGTPVVATAVGGIPEQIKEGVTGFLTPPADANLMSTRINQLLSNNALYQYISVQSSEYARVNFALKREAMMYLDWYRDILENRQRYNKDYL